MERVPRANTLRPTSKLRHVACSSSLALTHTRVKDLHATRRLPLTWTAVEPTFHLHFGWTSTGRRFRCRWRYLLVAGYLSRRCTLRVASEYLWRQSRVNESEPRAFVRDRRRSVLLASDAFALLHSRKYYTFLVKILEDRGHGEGKTLAHESEQYGYLRGMEIMWKRDPIARVVMTFPLWFATIECSCLAGGLRYT